MVKVGTTLSREMEENLKHTLRRNLDVFAWSSKDMPGIDPNFVCHRLAIDPMAKTVQQKKRKMSMEKQKAVQEETDKLVKAKFIREVKYPTWLANVVVVKKSSGKWRMCTDYTDLNKVCPKDSYPLPSIDQLVDNASGYDLLSFMDAYSGYNQIRMHPEDEEKTAFMTDRANHCYRVMAFGLRNAGATFQRLVDKVFKNEIGKTIEVYVDDMVVKLTKEEDHQNNLNKVFDLLRRHDIRLNPEKCSFGVQAGKCLGFMLTRRGIEVNPEKCKAIMDMRSPVNAKEVQKLTGRISSLARFLSCSADKNLPFFQLLRKNEKFCWTERCEEAFQKLKEFLMTPPILVKPKLGTPLILYLAVSETACSSVLVQEEGKEQKPVYFTNKVLHRAEVRYQKIEKVALALVSSARKLRPYFQSHTIIVRTDQPIRQVLHKPDLAGRMVAWTVELSEFDIAFEPRGAIKAQVLADFLVEMTMEKGGLEVAKWVLSVDGSSNLKGSGAGVALEGPDGVLIEQSLRFEFKASNNQAEYEALLEGMRLAIEVEVKDLEAKSDSQLVFGQVTGSFVGYSLTRQLGDSRHQLVTLFLGGDQKGLKIRFGFFKSLILPTRSAQGQLSPLQLGSSTAM